MLQDKIVIIDLGSTEVALLAREIRRMGVFTEIHPHDSTKDFIDGLGKVKGFILYGGENNVVDGHPIEASGDILGYGLPILTIKHGDAPDLPDNDEKRRDLLSRFIFDECGAEANWSIESFIEEKVQDIRKQVGTEKVLLALSGGVDSSVVAALLIRAIGKQLTCIHVNHGLLREGESQQVIDTFQKELGSNLIYIDATDRYLDALAGVADPEQKRKIIGSLFIDIFQEEAEKLDDIKFLAQGTIYPDIIESGTKTQKKVKSHHNVGGLPEKMNFQLVEPLDMLFKDEVRLCGEALGLAHKMVYRQPFPGPGLGVRCVGAITRDRLAAVRHSDVILREEFDKAGLNQTVWQYFTVIPDVRSVGVRDGGRAYEWPCVLRAVNTVDALTASIEQLPYDLLARITARITAEVPGVNRVLYDITPKPTGSIEWE